jgi:hypothetical protein
VKFRGGISNRVVVQGGLVKFPQKKKKTCLVPFAILCLVPLELDLD